MCIYVHIHINIYRYREYLHIPKQCNLSKEAKDCVYRLICSPKKRMSFNHMKRHPFFKKVPWSNLRKMKPPFVPEMDHDADIKYFDTVKDVDLEIQVSDHLGTPRATKMANSKKRKSSFNNLDPRGVCAEAEDEAKKGIIMMSAGDDPNMLSAGGGGSNRASRNHFYGFTFERVPVERHDIFAPDTPVGADH